MKRRLKRLFYGLLVVAFVGAGLYGASWLNSRRLFLEVGPAEVSVSKGRMLPVGREPFIPMDPTIRRAYQPFPLPGGMKVGRGVTVFDDRVELDQALFRLLVDAAQYSLEADNERTVELLPRYIEKMKAIPGVSTQQQVELQAIQRDAAYVSARQRVEEAEAKLRAAVERFEEAASGRGSRHADAEDRARYLRRVLRILQEGGGQGAPVEATQTASTSTSAVSLQ